MDDDDEWDDGPDDDYCEDCGHPVANCTCWDDDDEEDDD